MDPTDHFGIYFGYIRRLFQSRVGPFNTAPLCHAMLLVRAVHTREVGRSTGGARRPSLLCGITVEPTRPARQTQEQCGAAYLVPTTRDWVPAASRLSSNLQCLRQGRNRGQRNTKRDDNTRCETIPENHVLHVALENVTSAHAPVLSCSGAARKDDGGRMSPVSYHERPLEIRLLVHLI